ncbi:uncharacterized protein LOC134256447 [Saccostrea cucullata]|uniref:uncharacterized protein LOC134256447 n=1 Tax=Saccostrea cuccullata TaxID=36930 RepID=UPI002ED0FEF3
MATNSAFHSLSWDNSYPVQNPQQRLYRQCDFNCMCCAKMQLGNYCPCNVPKQSCATQTVELDTFPQTMTVDNLWKRGTSEHTSLQSLITKSIDKYNLKSSKDTHLQTAVKEVVTIIRAGNHSLQTGDEEKKVKNRILRALEWRRYYSRKRTHASSLGVKVSKLLRKNHAGTDQAEGDKENLLPQDLHEVGHDNRGFSAESQSSSSDGDIPLAALAQRKELKKP